MGGLPARLDSPNLKNKHVWIMFFKKKLKFERIIPTCQDEWSSNDTKTISANIPARALIVYNFYVNFKYQKIPN